MQRLALGSDLFETTVQCWPVLLQPIMDHGVLGSLEVADLDCALRTQSLERYHVRDA